MTLLKRLFGDLFNSSEDNSQNNEQILREKIVHTEFFLAEYEQWLVAGLQNDLLQNVREHKAIRSSNPLADSIYFPFRSEASNGFYFISEEEWSNKDYAFVTHFISQQLKNLGYVLSNSRRDVREKEGQLICTEDFYFKLPLSSRTQKPIPQLWGNVILQHHSIDDRSRYVKVMAHIYNDRSYHEAKDFEDLEEILLSGEIIS